MINVIFLGTSCMVPTKERNNSAIFIRYKNEGVLLDCGENTQRQFKIAGISLTKITKIFISHWDGDHILGLPGLLQTLSNSEYNGILDIYGPKKTKEFMTNIFKTFYFDNKLKINVHEVGQTKFFENKDFILESFNLEHKITTLGINFIEKDRRKINLAYTKKKKIPEGPLLGKLQKNKLITWKGKIIKPEMATYVIKGKKITYISDTVYCKNCIKFSKETDVLICNTTYASKLEEKARKYMHMTAKQAAQIANLAGVKNLILTHFSQRYKTTDEILEDAKEVFKDVVCAYDFMKVKI